MAELYLKYSSEYAVKYTYDGEQMASSFIEDKIHGDIMMKLSENLIILLAHGTGQIVSAPLEVGFKHRFAVLFNEMNVVQLFSEIESEESEKHLRFISFNPFTAAMTLVCQASDMVSDDEVVLEDTLVVTSDIPCDLALEKGLIKIGKTSVEIIDTQELITGDIVRRMRLFDVDNILPEGEYIVEAVSNDPSFFRGEWRYTVNSFGRVTHLYQEGNDENLVYFEGNETKFNQIISLSPDSKLSITKDHSIITISEYEFDKLVKTVQYSYNKSGMLVATVVNGELFEKRHYHKNNVIERISTTHGIDPYTNDNVISHRLFDETGKEIGYQMVKEKPNLSTETIDIRITKC